MTEHRVLVCGGRHYQDAEGVCRVLDGLLPRPTVIIEGGATGADLLANWWAIDRDVALRTFAVDHSLDGPWPGAGPRRNARMLADSKPNLVVAFKGGRGTADMVRRAKAAGVRVIEVR
jgi:hypothetical protein